MAALQAQMGRLQQQQHMNQQGSRSSLLRDPYAAAEEETNLVPAVGIPPMGLQAGWGVGSSIPGIQG